MGQYPQNLKLGVSCKFLFYFFKGGLATWFLGFVQPWAK